MLAHVLDDWSRALGLVPDEGQVPSDATLARGGVGSRGPARDRRADLCGTGVRGGQPRSAGEGSGRVARAGASSDSRQCIPALGWLSYFA